MSANIETQRPKKISLIKIANVEDEATGDAFEHYRFVKPVGRKGHELFPREIARSSRKLRDVLIGKNWVAPYNDAQAEQIVAKAIRKKPCEYQLCAAHVGWRPERKGFVLHDGVVGAPGGRLILKPPLWLNKCQHPLLAVKGDLPTWIEKVAKPSRFSTRIMLLTAATFAAPLLAITGLQPFALVLFGTSKVGKSTALLAAASAIGVGQESQLPNFNTTDAAFQERARLFNDLILPGNEIGLLKGLKKDAYVRLRNFIYTFAEGRETARHSRSGYAATASSATWRGIFLANAEHSIDALAEMAGETRDHGEYARCIDVPATGKGMKTIFDRRPASVRPKGFSAWARGQLIALRSACEQNHGVAIGPYLKYLMSLGDRAPDLIGRYMAEFHTALATDLQEGALQHAARNFALVYAGGRLAIDAGILPWKPERLLSAVVACFRAALREMGRQEDIGTKALRVLRQKLKDAKLPPRKGGVDPNAHGGFREKGKAGTTVTVKSTVFRDWFPDAHHHRAALKWLNDTGRLIKSDDALKPNGKNTEWAVTSPRWSGDKKVKSVRFTSLAPAPAVAPQGA